MTLDEDERRERDVGDGWRSEDLRSRADRDRLRAALAERGAGPLEAGGCLFRKLKRVFPRTFSF